MLGSLSHSINTIVLLQSPYPTNVHGRTCSALSYDLKKVADTASVRVLSGTFKRFPSLTTLTNDLSPDQKCDLVRLCLSTSWCLASKGVAFLNCDFKKLVGSEAPGYDAQSCYRVNLTSRFILDLLPLKAEHTDRDVRMFLFGRHASLLYNDIKRTVSNRDVPCKVITALHPAFVARCDYDPLKCKNYGVFDTMAHAKEFYSVCYLATDVVRDAGMDMSGLKSIREQDRSDASKAFRDRISDLNSKGTEVMASNQESVMSCYIEKLEAVSKTFADAIVDNVASPEAQTKAITDVIDIVRGELAMRLLISKSNSSTRGGKAPTGWEKPYDVVSNTASSKEGSAMGSAGRNLSTTISNIHSGASDPYAIHPSAPKRHFSRPSGMLTERDTSDRSSEDPKRSPAPNVAKAPPEKVGHQEVVSAPGKHSFRPRGTKGETKIMSTGDMKERRNWRAEEDEGPKTPSGAGSNLSDSGAMMKRIMGMTATDKKDQGEVSKRADLARSLPGGHEKMAATPAKQPVVESSPNVTSSMKKRFCRPSGTESYGSRPSSTPSGPEAHPSSLPGPLVIRALFPEEESSGVLLSAVAASVLEDTRKDEGPKLEDVPLADVQSPPLESQVTSNVVPQSTDSLASVYQDAPSNDEGFSGTNPCTTDLKTSSPSLTHHKGKKVKDVRKST